MDITQAKELLICLVDGVNPITGEVLPENDSCNQVEIVRALNLVLRALENKAKRPQKSQSVNAGKPWSLSDEQQLCYMYDAGCSKNEICNYLQRSVGGVAAKLVRLGKINAREDFR